MLILSVDPWLCLQACPYFLSRALKEDSDLIICPYNYLVDPMVRNAVSINKHGWSIYTWTLYLSLFITQKRKRGLCGNVCFVLFSCNWLVVVNPMITLSWSNASNAVIGCCDDMITLIGYNDNTVIGCCDDMITLIGCNDDTVAVIDCWDDMITLFGCNDDTVAVTGCSEIWLLWLAAVIMLLLWLVVVRNDCLD